MARPVFILVLIACVAGLAAEAAGQPNPTRESYRRGLAIVNRAYLATGGEAAANAAGTMAFRLDGTLFARNQSFRPGTPFDGFPVKTSVYFDLRSERIVWEQSSSLPGGLTFASRSVAGRASEGFNLNLERGVYSTLPANAPIFGQTARLVPIYFLKKLLEQRGSLRSAGRARFLGRPHDLVTAVWNNQVFTLYFDTGTGLLAKAETLAPDATAGDDVFEFVTTGYRSYGELRMPTRYEQRRSGSVTRSSLYSEFRIEQGIPPELTERPASAGLFTTPSFEVKQLRPDIFLVNGVSGGGYRVLFVELADGVLVVDAPGNSQASAQIIREIRSRIPGKMIRYVVPTHHHEDHIGGLREYVAEGATIVTTSGNRAFFDSVARAEYTLLPDALSRSPKTPVFLEVNDERSFGPVVIRNVGSPHAADMYVVYAPAAKLLFQSDLYNWPDRAVTDSTVDLVEKLDRLGWDVERMISSHGGIVELAKVRAEIAEFKSKK